MGSGKRKYFLMGMVLLFGGSATTLLIAAVYEQHPYLQFSAAHTYQRGLLLPDALTLEAREHKKGVGEVGDFELPESEAVDLWASVPRENMGAAHPNRGLDMILRGPPGGTPNMIPYNRA